MKQYFISIVIFISAVTGLYSQGSSDPVIKKPKSLTILSEEEQFNLLEIIDLGLKNNLAISAKRQEVKAKRAAFQASKRLLNPELELHKGRAKSYEGDIERSTNGISLNQYLENPFKRNYRVQIFEKELQATEYQFNFLKLKIVYEIKKLFYRILLLKKKEQLAQKNLDSIREIYQLIKKRANLGEVKELEAIKLYVETLKAQNELNKMRTELKLAKKNLNKYLGNSMPPDFSIVGELDYTPFSIEEKSLLEKALHAHPLIKEKEAKLDQTKSNLNYVKWQRFPDFKLSGFIHKELDGRNKGVGISLDIPLWNFKSKEIAEAESLYLKENAEFKALRIELSTKVKSQLSQMKLSEETLRIFHEGLLKQAAESLKISEVSYKQGEISLIDYFDSQRTYHSILKDYQESLYAWNADKSALEKIIGEELK